MDQFDFDQIDNKPRKIENQHIKQSPQARNFKNSDFDEQPNEKIQSIQTNKTNVSQYFDSYFDEIEKKQPNKIHFKVSEKNKQNQSILPRINNGKLPEQRQKKPAKPKMDLALEQLSEKRAIIQNEQKKIKKQSSDYDDAIYKTRSKEKILKQELKANQFSIKEKLQQKKLLNEKNQQIHSFLLKESQSKPAKHQQQNQVQIKIEKQNEDQYEQQYEEQIDQNQKIKPKPSPKQVSSVTGKQNPQKAEKLKEQSITKYQQMVLKSFPEDQSQQKIKKLKPEIINKLNDKIRQMIKGFSAQLTHLIDKNLVLLKKPQNQIKQQIQGESIDPLQAQIKLLEQSKKNNQKMLEISQKQLQSTVKTSQKTSLSVTNSIQVTEQIEAVKKYITICTRQIGNLKNQIEKQEKRAVKISEGISNSNDDYSSKFRNSLQISQKLSNTRIEFQKNKKKISQLVSKEKILEDKITQVSKKKTEILEQAANKGISFCKKQDQKNYDQLKKKKEQLVLFESKFKSLIKSKQTLIQHEVSDLELLVEDCQKKYHILNQSSQSSRQLIFQQISKAQNNSKLNSNAKQILLQLQAFMSQDHLNLTDQQISSLNYISENIYKKQYHPKSQNSKFFNQDHQPKKITYKNYLLQIAKINQQNKNKATTLRRNSQINPFRKAITPAESSQSNQINDKMNKTKDNKVQLQKQKQRIWKSSSNTQSLIKNPLKRELNQNNNKSRYQKDKQEEEYPVNNKQIIKLINKNKEKIILKQEEKIKVEKNLGIKPFNFKISVKDREKQQSANGIALILEKSQKAIDTSKQSVENGNKDKETGKNSKEQNSLTQIIPELKHRTNSITPFHNLNFKKTEKNISSQKIQSKQMDKDNFSSDEANSLKPKRFNLRQKKQNVETDYLPSNGVLISKQTINEKQAQILSQQGNYSNQPIKPKLSDKKFLQQPFDPFKKFMANQNRQYKNQSNFQSKTQLLKLNQNQQIFLDSTKPKLNLYKKQAVQNDQDSKKLILLKNHQQQTPLNSIKQQQKFVNPYAVKKQTLQSEGLQIQRQNRVKKIDSSMNSIKLNKNIFNTAQDATSNQILLLGSSQNVKVKHQLPVLKQSKIDDELTVNDLLGIKKKKIEIDQDLIIDLPIKIKNGVKAKTGKTADFFGDLEI